MCVPNVKEGQGKEQAGNARRSVIAQPHNQGIQHCDVGHAGNSTQSSRQKVEGTGVRLVLLGEFLDRVYPAGSEEREAQQAEQPEVDRFDKILAEAGRVLAEAGVEVMGTALRERLMDYGLKQDDDTGRILFPPDEVDQAVANAPRSFTLYNRHGEPHTELGEDKVHFVPGSSAVQVLDHRTGQTRLATTADFVDYVRLADGLPHLAYLATAFSTRTPTSVDTE